MGHTASTQPKVDTLSQHSAADVLVTPVHVGLNFRTQCLTDHDIVL
jgi:hypothetical protein